MEFPAHTRHPMEAALAACARPAMMDDTLPTDRHRNRLLEQVRATGGSTPVISSEFFADAPDDGTIGRIVEQLGGDRVHVLATLRPLAKIMPPSGSSTAPSHLGLPENLLQPVPDTTNRSLTLAETEMLRNLNVEFRGNGLPDELYSRLVRNGAVLHMKNTCSPSPRDVKIPTPRWAVEAAAAIGAEAAERPDQQGPAEPGIAPEAAARALSGALAAAASAAPSRSVHQTPSKELVRVLGHRCPKRLRRR
ncbi:hypothetical protein [Streptomyces sp. NPDC005890]|uniref:hypothetical protein n=1 Tax=Streptomyces sp. NPDC005890 TaxID=3154568 RepID=UPI0033C4B5D5